MSSMNRPWVVLSVAVWAIAAAALPTMGAAGAETPAAQDAFVSVHKCSQCHSVAAVAIEATSEKMKSIDLGGYTTDDIAALGAFLRREVELDGAKHKKPYKGTDEELERIVAWLSGLEPAAATE